MKLVCSMSLQFKWPIREDKYDSIVICCGPVGIHGHQRYWDKIFQKYLKRRMPLFVLYPIIQIFKNNLWKEVCGLLSCVFPFDSCFCSLHPRNCWHCSLECLLWIRNISLHICTILYLMNLMWFECQPQIILEVSVDIIILKYFVYVVHGRPQFFTVVVLFSPKTLCWLLTFWTLSNYFVL